jgi:hypothetical protein
VDKKSKKKTTFKEGTGPFGVGETLEDVEKLDVFEALVSTENFDEITKDLDPEQQKHVMKEAHAHAEAYQKILDKFTDILSTPEGRKKFKQMALKKSGGK